MHNPLAVNNIGKLSMNFSLSKYSGAVMMAASLLIFAAHAAATPRLSGETNSPNNSTFVLGENITLTFHASGLTASKPTTVNIKVKEEFGVELASASILVAPSPTQFCWMIKVLPAYSRRRPRRPSRASG